MTVYVDDMRAKRGFIIFCHMIADSDVELHSMADRIGVDRIHHQAPPRHPSHYDIALSKKTLAMAGGAILITKRQLGCMVVRRRVTGSLGLPEDAVDWARSYLRNAERTVR